MPQYRTSGDDDILKLFSEYVNLHAHHLSELTGRGMDGIWRALQRLERLGYLRRRKLPEDIEGNESDHLPRVWFMKQLGWDLAFKREWINHKVEASDEKSYKNLPHDISITEYHMALWRKFRHKLVWSQLYPVLHQPEVQLVPDAFFYLDLGNKWPAFFIERENVREDKYEKGKSRRIRKAEAYAKLAEEGLYQARFHSENFRVIWLMNSTTEARNLVTKLHDLGGDLNHRRYWACDLKTALNVEESLFLTPPDFTHRAYGFTDC
jgi:hypothetical protein